MREFETYYMLHIKSVPKEFIFVYETDSLGTQNKGSARWAYLHAGAKRRATDGISGNSYGIVTRERGGLIHPSISTSLITLKIRKLYRLMDEHPKIPFLIGVSHLHSISKYPLWRVARMFINAGPIPENIIFQQNFCTLIKKELLISAR